MKYPCGNCKEVREKDYYGYIGICDKCKKRIEYDNWAHQQQIERLKEELNKKRKGKLHQTKLLSRKDFT